ncbi:hypothetical protein, partial [Collinsella aerofaciens]|uniref:hypothetical protein n=1 Tax=Collinsella aerofaciens TaxID=74426 RepID=UPI001C9DC48A
PRPRSPGRGPMIKLLNFQCSRCSVLRDQADHFLVNINRLALVGELHALWAEAGLRPSAHILSTNPTFSCSV